MAKQTRWLSLSVLWVVFLCSSVGCKQAKDDQPPSEGAQPVARVSAMLEHLPADRTQVVLFISDLHEAAARGDEIIEAYGEIEDPAAARKMREEVLSADVLGGYLFDTEQWKQVGIMADGPAIFAVIDERSVVAAEVAEPETFSAFVAEREGEEARRFDQNGRTYWASGRRAWTFEDGRVFIGEASPAEGSGESSAKQLAQALAQHEEPVLTETDSFAQFREVILAEALAGVYIPPQEELARNLLRELNLSGRRSPLGESFTDNFIDSFRGVGLGATFDAERFVATGWAGFDEEASAELTRILTPDETADWSGLAGQDAIALARIQIHPTHAWQWLQSSLQPPFRQMLGQGLQGVNRAAGSGFDLQRDVIGKLTGNIAFAAYPVDVGRGPWDLLTIDGSMGGLIVVQFVDDRAPVHVLEALEHVAKMTMTGAQITVRDHAAKDGADPVRVLEFDALAPKLYTSGRMLALASTTLPETQVAGLLGATAESSGESSQSTQLSIPARGFGLYVDVERLLEGSEILRRIQMPDGAVEKFAVSARPGPNGLVARAEVRPGAYLAFTATAFQRYVKASKASEAQVILRKMSDGAKRYFERDQVYHDCSTDGVTEPWHCATGSGGAHPGYPVKWDEKVFPGGTNQRLVTTGQIPQRGAKIGPEPAAEKHRDATLRILNLDFVDPTYFQYTYETNGETGSNAEATLRAVHDFDPSSDRNHTVEVRLRVDPSRGVLVSPPVTLNAFE